MEDTLSTAKLVQDPKNPAKTKKARINTRDYNRYNNGQLSNSDQSSGTRRSCLRESKLSQNPQGTTNKAPSPACSAIVKNNPKSIVSQTSNSITKVSSPIQPTDCTTPSSLTEVETEQLQLHQQEITYLRANFQSLSESVQSLQLSMQEQGQNQSRLTNSIEEIQSTLQVHQGSQNNLAAVVQGLEENQTSFATSISVVMHLLQKMDIKLSAISTTTNIQPSSNYPPGEASQGGKSLCWTPSKFKLQVRCIHPHNPQQSKNKHKIF